MFPAVAPHNFIIGSAKIKPKMEIMTADITENIIVLEKVFPASSILPSPTFLTIIALAPVPSIIPRAMSKYNTGIYKFTAPIAISPTNSSIKYPSTI